MKLPMLKNSKGKNDAAFTMAFLTFNSMLLWFWLSMFQLVPEFKASEASLFMTPVLALYFGRRYTDNKSESQTEE